MTPAELVATVAGVGLFWLLVRTPPQRPGHPPDPAPLVALLDRWLQPTRGLVGWLLGDPVPPAPLAFVLTIGTTRYTCAFPLDRRVWRSISAQLRALEGPADLERLAGQVAGAIGLPPGALAPLSAAQLLALVELLATMHRRRVVTLRRGLLRPAAIALAGGLPKWLRKTSTAGAAQ